MKAEQKHSEEMDDPVHCRLISLVCVPRMEICPVKRPMSPISMQKAWDRMNGTWEGKGSRQAGSRKV